MKETRKILFRIQKLTRYSYNTVIKIVLKIIIDDNLSY